MSSTSLEESIQVVQDLLRERGLNIPVLIDAPLCQFLISELRANNCPCRQDLEFNRECTVTVFDRAKYLSQHQIWFVPLLWPIREAHAPALPQETINLNWWTGFDRGGYQYTLPVLHRSTCMSFQLAWMTDAKFRDQYLLMCHVEALYLNEQKKGRVPVPANLR